jgi:chemotaxis signal transduction protein
VAAFTSLIVFETAGSALALNAAIVEEVLEAPVPMPLPLLPRHLLGLSPWRGRALCVVDLAALLDLAASGPPAERAIVLAAGAFDAALLCDRIRGFVDSPSQLAPVPPGLPGRLSEVADGILSGVGQPIVVVNGAELLERASVKR